MVKGRLKLIESQELLRILLIFIDNGIKGLKEIDHIHSIERKLLFKSSKFSFFTVGVDARVIPAVGVDTVFITGEGEVSSFVD